MNSYLKYLWCVDRILPPPHCPFDSIILAKLKLPPDCEDRWTHGAEADYRAWVVAAKVAAQSTNESLAEWELREWSGG